VKGGTFVQNPISREGKLKKVLIFLVENVFRSNIYLRSVLKTKDGFNLCVGHLPLSKEEENRSTTTGGGGIVFGQELLGEGETAGSIPTKKTKKNNQKGGSVLLSLSTLEKGIINRTKKGRREEG